MTGLRPAWLMAQQESICLDSSKGAGLGMRLSGRAFPLLAGSPGAYLSQHIPPPRPMGWGGGEEKKINPQLLESAVLLCNVGMEGSQTWG